MAEPARETPEVSTPKAETLYRYDDHGRVVIVDSLARVPAALRHTAKPISLAPASPAGEVAAEAVLRAVHWPSFAGGVGAAAIVVLLGFALQRRLRGFIRVALIAGAIALGATAYFGWLRRTTGHDTALLASPQTMIEDARRAVEKMNASQREQQKLLEELQRQP